MRIHKEHSYFLDPNMAIEIARQHNSVMTPSGALVMQICYYDGSPLDQALDNIMCVPVNQFTEFFSRNKLPVPTYLVFPEEQIQGQEAQDLICGFKELVEQVNALRTAQSGPDPLSHKDAYFLDSKAAYNTALQRNRVRLIHPTIDGLQVCYYDGDPFPDALENMVHAPMSKLLHLLIYTRYRLPNILVFSDKLNDDERSEKIHAFRELLVEVDKHRERLVNLAIEKRKLLKPVFKPNQALRVFFSANRMTTVMQYVSKNIAKSLNKLGCKTQVTIENNDKEALSHLTRLNEFIAFNPHIVVNINHANNEALHPDLFNVCWWQDPMPNLVEKIPIKHRERDILMSFSPKLDDMLYQCGVKKPLRQHFCVDTDIFKQLPEVNRENKVVFVGSSAHTWLTNNPNTVWVANQLIKLIEQGEPIDNKIIETLALQSGISTRIILWQLLHYAVRDTSVRWLCQNPHIPVEVYGRHWESDPIVYPFFKGEVAHGQELVQIYNSAKYALVSHSFDVNSQRLNEVSACGCIPVVYDCRHSSEPPFWENECLYFRTQQDLYQQLLKTPIGDVKTISKHYSYDTLAKRILSLVDSMLNEKRERKIVPELGTHM